MTTILSPDGTLVMEITSSSENTGGVGGMGHDADDYFTNTTSLAVYEVASRRLLLSRSWSSDYDANRGTSIGERPDSMTFSADGASVVLRFGARETLVPLSR